MATNKKITQLDELTPATWADDDVIAIVDISAQETKKIQLSTFRGAVTGVSSLNASTPLTVDSATGDVTISMAIDGGGTINAVFDEDNMASNSPTALATQQSIKAYVDSQVGTVDTLAEILANGNTSGGTNIVVSSGDVITTNTINETTAAAGVTIDGVLVKDGQVDGRDVSVDGTKLDTVETNADVTDTANVTAAGALMDSELTNITAVKALDQGVATTDTPTFAGLITAGNVDGRDVSADGAKLDGIEAGADVTDTANVTAAGALMDSELTNIAAVKALDQGVATTDSPSFAGLTATTADINGGTIDGAVIGGASAAAGTFTTFTSTGIDDNATSTALTIDSSENVGIGTAPALNLHVHSSADTALLLTNTTSGSDADSGLEIKVINSGAHAYINQQENAELRFRTNDTDRMAITSGGNLEMANAAGPALLNEQATSTNPSVVSNKADPDTGLGWVSANVGALVAGGAMGLTWNASADIGIKTSAPEVSLHVQDSALAGSDTWTADVQAVFGRNGNSGIAIYGAAANSAKIKFAKPTDYDVATIGYNFSTDVLNFSLAATSSWEMVTGSFYAINAAGPALLNEAATSTNPTVLANKVDTDTGLGWVSTNTGALIAAGTKVLDWTSGQVNISGALSSTGTHTVGTNSSGNSATLQQAGTFNFKLNGDTPSQLGVVSWTNNSGTQTGNMWGTGDSSASTVLRVKSLGIIDLVPGGVGIDATVGYRATTTEFSVPTGTGPALLNEVASSANPTLVPNRAAPTFGVGGGTNEVALIGNGSEVLTVGANTLGFFGSAPIVKRTITGSRGGNAALASLLTALAATGLLTDSTTA